MDASCPNPQLGPDGPSQNAAQPDEGGDDLQQRVLEDTMETLAADDIDLCGICLNEIPDTEKCILLPCGHELYGFSCIMTWLEELAQQNKPGSCPLDRRVVSQIQRVHDGGILECARIKVRDVPRLSENLRPNRPSRRRPFRRSIYETESTPPVDFRIGRRREIYRTQRYSKHVGSNPRSGYREITPALFRSEKTLQSRAAMWIRRELQVFSFLNLGETDTTMPDHHATKPNGALPRRKAINAEFLLYYIVSMLKFVDIMGSSGQAQAMLGEYLGSDNARLFLHELKAWLRSPYTDLDTWDSLTQYDPPPTAPASGSPMEQPGSSLRGTSESSNRRYFRGRPGRGCYSYYNNTAARIERRRGPNRSSTHLENARERTSS